MKRPTVGIATDGAHSTKERLTRYRAVDLSSGLELFNHSIGNKTNNIGEFLAIVEAVKYILRHPEAPRIIYSDSITAITWYRNKQTASSRRCEQLQLAEIFLKVMAAKIEDIQVLHWDNREWGETPADFGDSKFNPQNNHKNYPFGKVVNNYYLYNRNVQIRGADLNRANTNYNQ